MSCVVWLREVRRGDLGMVGGKAANLGELTALAGVEVPDGFCVMTDAFDAGVLTAPAVAAIGEALQRFDASTAFAVRSSATAEDQPGASFAGQHDSFLDVVGADAVLAAVRRCSASLSAERAMSYRQRHGIDDARMAVVVQVMVAADAAGVLFTADPITSNRRVSVIEAVRGTGDALVSGHADPDRYVVRDERIVEPAAGVLTEAQVLRLVRLGRRIEAHFGVPQDIEWCLRGSQLFVVQARPITTVFPLPPNDGGNRVWLSVGHQQMMTDAMTPLGVSFWQLTTPAPMAEVGGRLFVEVTARLGAPSVRDALLDLIGRSDPLTVDALRTVLARDFVPPLPDPPSIPASTDDLPEPDPAIVEELIAASEASVASARDRLAALSGTALLDAIRDDLQELRRVLFDPRSHRVFMSAMEASWWLADHLGEWLGERDAVDVLTRSVPHDITAQMGLDLLDVADVIRPYPEVLNLLDAADFLDRLPDVPGGAEARAAIESWLDRYGMRGVGEIDITRPRWAERPSMLAPLILGAVRNAEPGDAARRVEQGRAEADAKAADVLARLRGGPDGDHRARETERRIAILRAFIGYREYPKYGMVSRYFVYKQALLREADRLVRDGVLAEREDVFFLGFDEFAEVVRSGHVDRALIAERRQSLRTYESLVPPRVLTSDGERIDGAVRLGDAPAGALAGLAVSTGVVEGRARIVLDPAVAELAPGEILVTRYTDPSWTPLFLTVAGVVTEVGGLMTHGAVVAREYGLPCVVAVAGATSSLRDGQRVRLDGTRGYLLPLGP